MTMKLKVTDIYTKQRTVEVADTCPGCGADLTAENALKEWSKGELRFIGSYAPGEDTGFRVSEQALPEGNDSYLDGLEYQCVECNEIIAAGISSQKVALDNIEQMTDVLEKKTEVYDLAQRMDTIDDRMRVIGKLLSTSDSVQTLQILCGLRAAGIPPATIETAAASMGMPPSDLNSLLERSEEDFEAIKDIIAKG